MIDTCKHVYAEDVEVGDELDLDGDEYGDNELAMFSFAKVDNKQDVYRNGDPWVVITTPQGRFEAPAGHRMKVKIAE